MGVEFGFDTGISDVLLSVIFKECVQRQANVDVDVDVGGSKKVRRDDSNSRSSAEKHTAAPAQAYRNRYREDAVLGGSQRSSEGA